MDGVMPLSLPWKMIMGRRGRKGRGESTERGGELGRNGQNPGDRVWSWPDHFSGVLLAEDNHSARRIGGVGKLTPPLIEDPENHVAQDMDRGNGMEGFPPAHQPSLLWDIRSNLGNVR